MIQERTAAVDKQIARRLMLAREDADLVKSEVAEKLGITKQAYTPWERGDHPFSVGEVFKFSQMFGRPVEWFLGLDTGGLSDDDLRILAPFRSIKNKALRQMAIDQMRAIAGASASNEVADNGRE